MQEDKGEKHVSKRRQKVMNRFLIGFESADVEEQQMDSIYECWNLKGIPILHSKQCSIEMCG